MPLKINSIRHYYGTVLGIVQATTPDFEDLARLARIV